MSTDTLLIPDRQRTPVPRADAAAVVNRAFEPGDDPKYLLPKMGGTPVSEPAVYRSLYILDTVDAYLGNADAASTRKELNGPVDPFNDADLVDENKRKAAVGALMVHSQAWEQSGLALGNLLQSVCLAPGEVTRVAVIDWRRRETGASVRSSEQSESVSSDIESERAVNEVQRAVASEAQSGKSSSFAASASVQGGATFSTLFASANVAAAANSTTALTAQFSAGTRDLAASATNAISQRTAEKSQSLRSRRQSVVQEVSQQESEQMSSRILANYNRRHSLNVEYFEVLQRYAIKTRLVGWERCLFVPLKPLDFTDPAVLKRHQSELIAIVRELGAGDLATTILEALGKLQQAEDERKKILKGLQAREVVLTTAIGPLSLVYAMPRGGEDKRAVYGNLQSQLANVKVSLPSFDEFNRLADADFVQLSKTLQLEAERAKAEYQRALASFTIPIGEVLNSSRLFLSQQIWLRMDSYRIYRVLEPYTLDGQALTRRVDPHPVGVFGNYLAFRWGFGSEAADLKRRAEFEKKYLQTDDSTGVETSVALPTSGVFAEAVLGRGEAAEVIDKQLYGTWEANQPPLLPPDIARLKSRDRARSVDLDGPDFASALAQLRATPIADASHIGSVLGGITKGDLFRNMGGLEQALALSGKLAEQSGAGATRAGDRAAEMQAKVLDTLVEVLNSDVGKAAVAEFVMPGAGPAMLGLGKKASAKCADEDGDDDSEAETSGSTDKAQPATAKEKKEKSEATKPKEKNEP